MTEYTTEAIIKYFKQIKSLGWIREAPKRQRNQGGAGNTLEDLLGVKENNFPLPDIGNWELKTHKVKSTALLTLGHRKPKPDKVVPRYLLPNFGWPHKEAGKKYPKTEKSFRQTVNAQKYSDRGFKIDVDYTKDKLDLDFDPLEIDDSSQLEYKTMLQDRFNKPIDEIRIDPKYEPYWDINVVSESLGKKVKDTFLADYVERKIKGIKEIKFVKVTMLKDFQFSKFIDLLQDKNSAFIDFDAATHKDHGVKFRVRENLIPKLYKQHEVVIE